MYCKGCKRVHEDRNWIYRKGWYCTKYHRPSGIPEFMPERILDDRRDYFNSTVQPFRGGELSREYVELYGTEGVDVTEGEARKAKYTWKDSKGWHTRKKSK